MVCSNSKATPIIKEVCDPKKMLEKTQKNNFISDIKEKIEHIIGDDDEEDSDEDSDEVNSRKKRSLGIPSDLSGAAAAVSETANQAVENVDGSMILDFTPPDLDTVLNHLNDLKSKLIKLNPRGLIEKIIKQLESAISCLYNELTDLIMGLRSIHVDKLMKGDGPWQQIDEYVKKSSMVKNATSLQVFLQWLDNRLPQDIGDLSKYVPENLQTLMMAEYRVGWDLSEALMEAAPEWRNHLASVHDALHNSKNAQEFCLAMTSILKNPPMGTGKLESSLEFLCKLDTGFFDNIGKQIEPYYKAEYENAMDAI
ncbi:unnamed protein product, partial [Meganyctiphanes norvegica]